MQPASKPAAPRLHKTVASTRLCQGRSAGKGLARGGEGRLFSRPCNFPRSRLAGLPARGVGPTLAGTPRGSGDGGGERGSSPAFFVFLSHPPCPFLSHFLSGRGRGPEREGKGEEGTGDIPVPQAFWVRLQQSHGHHGTRPGSPARRKGRGYSESQPLASVSPPAPLQMDTGHPYFGFEGSSVWAVSLQMPRSFL